MRIRQLVHIGVGNFHRAHQADYFQQLNDLSNNTSHSDQGTVPNKEHWQIIGISLRSQDEPLLTRLAAQEYQYHLIKRAPDGSEKLSKLCVHQDIIAAYQDPERAIECLSDAGTEIISFTITEGAYLFDQELMQLDWQHPDLLHDAQNLEHPKTIFGFLHNSLQRRRESHGLGVTLLSCDNIQRNGRVLQSALLQFIQRIDASLADWVSDEVCFPNTMVDRITPASSTADSDYLTSRYEIKDNAPVVSESFHQWVIEDNFRFSRPNLDWVGAIFTNDVSLFEDLKLKLLNGGHSCIGYLGSLMGYEYVHEAIADKALREFVKSYMHLDAKPSIGLTPEINIDDYIETLLQRFANLSIADKVERLCGDGISKLNNFLAPVVKDTVQAGRSLDRLAIIYAAYYAYLVRAANEDTWQSTLHEPQVDSSILARFRNDVALLLSLLGVSDQTERLLPYVEKNITRLESLGVARLLDQKGLTMPKQSVVAFGEALIDLIIQEGVFHPFVGGAPANVAVAVSKLGGHSHFIGAVGDDIFGNMIVDELERHSVDTNNFLTLNEFPTAAAYVSLDEQGERSFSFSRHNTADTHFPINAIPIKLFKEEAGIFHFGSNSLTSDYLAAITFSLIAIAKQNGWSVSFDVNLRHNLWPQKTLDKERIMMFIGLADFIKMSDEEMRDLEIKASVFNRQIDAVFIITSGPGLIRLQKGESLIEQQPESVHVVDTTGAGDAFFGAFIYFVAHNHLYQSDAIEYKPALEFAAACGAHSVQYMGAMNSYPEQNQLEISL